MQQRNFICCLFIFREMNRRIQMRSAVFRRGNRVGGIKVSHGPHESFVIRRVNEIRFVVWPIECGAVERMR